MQKAFNLSDFDEQSVCKNVYAVLVAKCDPPHEILNGSVLFLDSDRESLLPGDMITYMCDEGYELTGNENRFCLRSGNWSGKDPECICKSQ